MVWGQYIEFIYIDRYIEYIGLKIRLCQNIKRKSSFCFCIYFNNLFLFYFVKFVKKVCKFVSVYRLLCLIRYLWVRFYNEVLLCSDVFFFPFISDFHFTNVQIIQ